MRGLPMANDLPESWATALSLTGMIAFRWNLQTGSMTCSPMATCWFGRSCLHREVAPCARVESFYHCLRPQDRGRLREAIEHATKTASDIHAHVCMVREDGTLRDIVFHGRLDPGERGTATGLTGMLEDVTEKQKAERALQRSETRLRTLITSMAKAVWTTDSEGRVVEDSPTWRALTGQTVGETLGEGSLDAVHPEDRERTRRRWMAIVESGMPGEHAFRVRCADGVQRFMKAHAAPVRGPQGHVLEWTGATIDITKDTETDNERLRLRDELAAERARMTAVLDAMPSGLVIAEAPSGRVSYTNKQAEALLRQRLHASTVCAADTPQAVIRGVDGAVIPPERQPITLALARGEPVRDLELCFEWDDGPATWMRINVAPVFDETGKLVAAAGTLWDISCEVNARRNRERRQRERELYVGILGHDLRDPLCSITASASLLLSRGRVADVDRPLVERIVVIGDRMGRMIGNMLDLTRSQLAGGIPLKPRPVDLIEVIHRIVQECQARYPKRAINVRGDRKIQGIWDPDRLGQMLANLLGNALEHSQPNTPVAVRAQLTGTSATLRVHNLGPAIPDDVRASLFEPFHRLEGAKRRTRGAGLGLGLYIAHQIVVSHGGGIDVESAAETGTTLTVTLPTGPVAA